MKDCAESILVPADKLEKKKDERSFNYTILFNIIKRKYSAF